MSSGGELRELARFLEAHPAVREKVHIARSWEPAVASAGAIRLGDDCAAIPQPDGSHLLFAAEGMLENFVRSDPWFAGYSAVMVNLSDVAAMGGRPIAITDVMFTSSDELSEQMWEGMRAASAQYGVPIVGGHTTRSGPENGSPTMLAAAVLGKAGPRLLSSFEARAGDLLVFVIDLDGAYRGDQPFWNASTDASPERLRLSLDLLPRLAERELCRAAKDVSNGGIVGTLSMFCESSKVGSLLDLDRLPRPSGIDWKRWLISFPSFGYLLAVAPECLAATQAHFQEHGLVCEEAGVFRESLGISMKSGGEETLLDFSEGG